MIPVEAVETEEIVDIVEDTESIEPLFFKLASEGPLGGNDGLGRAVEFPLGGNRGGKGGCNLTCAIEFDCLGGNCGEPPYSIALGWFPILPVEDRPFVCNGGLFAVCLLVSIAGLVAGSEGVSTTLPFWAAVEAPMTLPTCSNFRAAMRADIDFG